MSGVSSKQKMNVEIVPPRKKTTKMLEQSSDENDLSSEREEEPNQPQAQLLSFEICFGGYIFKIKNLFILFFYTKTTLPIILAPLGWWYQKQSYCWRRVIICQKGKLSIIISKFLNFKCSKKRWQNDCSAFCLCNY